MSLSNFTYSGHPVTIPVSVLSERMAQVFAAGGEAVQQMAAELRNGPPELEDIGTRSETWCFGSPVERIITRESDWDWHDLRGMFWRDLRFRMESAGPGACEYFRLTFEHGNLTVSLALPEPLFDHVMAALRAVLKL